MSDGLVSESCRGCKYLKLLASYSRYMGGYFCDYICMEEKSRPCLAGDGCTEYAKKEKKRHGNSNNKR